MSHSLAIKTSGLTYHYSRTAPTLHDIALRVDKGAIYGFLGPNGSGKTTTLSLILGLLNIQKGEIEIFGRQLQSHRIPILRKTGCLIELPSLYGHLSARQNLEVYRPVYGVGKERLAEVLNIAGLEGTGSKPAKKFSLGMKQRLAIALALLPDPELLVLDEPTNGLDPNGIIELRELIKRLNRENGMTILVSSHLLAEVEKMISHVGIIYKGKMLFQGSLNDLHRFQQKGSRLLIDTSDNARALQVLAQYDPEKGDAGIIVPIRDPQQVADIQRRLLEHDLYLHLLQPQKNDLEQLFIDLTKQHS